MRSRVVLVAPDNRYLTHITPVGGASLSKKLTRAKRLCESNAQRYIQIYHLKGYVKLEVQS